MLSIKYMCVYLQLPAQSECRAFLVHVPSFHLLYVVIILFGSFYAFFNFIIGLFFLEICNKNPRNLKNDLQHILILMTVLTFLATTFRDCAVLM